VVKLLLSIDRKMGPVEGAENVELAAKYSKMYPGLIVVRIFILLLSFLNNYNLSKMVPRVILKLMTGN